MRVLICACHGDTAVLHGTTHCLLPMCFAPLRITALTHRLLATLHQYVHTCVFICSAQLSVCVLSFCCMWAHLNTFAKALKSDLVYCHPTGHIFTNSLDEFLLGADSK